VGEGRPAIVIEIGDGDDLGVVECRENSCMPGGDTARSDEPDTADGSRPDAVFFHVSGYLIGRSTKRAPGRI
jgi:hypothetical protein